MSESCKPAKWGCQSANMVRILRDTARRRYIFSCAMGNGKNDSSNGVSDATKTEPIPGGEQSRLECATAKTAAGE